MNESKFNKRKFFFTLVENIFSEMRQKDDYPAAPDLQSGVSWIFFTN